MALSLKKLGHDEVAVLKDGFDAWTQADFPTVAKEEAGAEAPAP